MGTAGILDTVIESGEQFVDKFTDNIVEIFTYDKNEIIESLEKVDNDNLLRLRCNLFNKLQDVLTDLSSRDLFARRKKKLIVEDIYIVSYSLINKLEHIRLRKILKSDPASESVMIQEDVNDMDDDNNILHTCTQLKATADQLFKQVNSLVIRVDSLESELTAVKETIHIMQAKEKGPDEEQKNGSMTEPENDTRQGQVETSGDSGSKGPSKANVPKNGTTRENLIISSSSLDWD